MFRSIRIAMKMWSGALLVFEVLDETMGIKLKFLHRFQKSFVSFEKFYNTVKR